MRGKLSIGAVCGALIALAGTCPAASAVGGPANWMYEPTSFTEVHLTLPQASITALEAEPKEYVEGTFSIAETDGTPGSAGPFSAPLTVGIELKGSLGSMRRLSEKAAFKIKFDKFVDGQSFLGLEKMTLNNMVQDPSMVHEATTYEAFHRMGVPAPHVGYTYLTVNGESYGVHLNIETQDAQSLENEFGTPFTAPPQHLYSGEYGADVSNELLHETAQKKWEALEVSEGKKKEKGDLEALVAAVEGTTPSFSERVAGVADLTEMTKDFLVEKFVGNFDGYAGIAPDYYRPNNFYLYSDTAGRFQLMPWGTDQTWQSDEHVDFGTGGGILFSECMADLAGCRQTYLQAAREGLSALDATTLDTVARCAALELRPWQEREATESNWLRLPDPAEDAAENLQKETDEVAATRAFIASRPGELAAFLGEPAPPPGSEPACPPLRPIGGFVEPEAEPEPEPEPEPKADDGSPDAPVVGPGAASSPGPTPPGAPTTSAGLAVVRVAHRGDSIALRLDVPGPGRAILRGSYGNRAWAACRGSAAVSDAGVATVACDFTGRFSSLLRRRWRRIRLDARFVSSTGSVEAIARSLELRRWPTHPSSS
ncbi:MAG TPA: CotH kinase family protein [Solirubrobacterales bacterium]|nr:CotH kinase family protein [Solirubrobacterales bacterium]